MVEMKDASHSNHMFLEVYIEWAGIRACACPELPFKADKDEDEDKDEAMLPAFKVWL